MSDDVELKIVKTEEKRRELEESGSHFCGIKCGNYVKSGLYCKVDESPYRCRMDLGDDLWDEGELSMNEIENIITETYPCEFWKVKHD